MDLGKIQQEINNHKIDGWLFYDFHHRDQMAYRILGLDPIAMCTRRWFYFIPAQGDPGKLVSNVEAFKLDPLPGGKKVYRTWEQLHNGLKEMLGSSKTIAMQYSPMNHIPYVSVVDAGTIELIRSFGYQIVSSADMVQIFESVLDDKAYRSHVSAAKKVQKVKDEAFAKISKAIRKKKKLTEYDIQQFICKRFKEEGLFYDDPAIVGVNDHPADPHFGPTQKNARVFKKGDKVLIDLWAKENKPKSIYYDITWVGYIGENPPQKYQEIFTIVRDARNAAVQFIRDRYAKKERLYGWQVDDACRKVVVDRGYGDYFVHRTGHSIGEYVHGNGANIDNFETKDERELVPGICFSIEPGIYLPGEMAARSEINVFIKKDGTVVVSGKEQQELILM